MVNNISNDFDFTLITKYNKENNNEYKNYVVSGEYLAIYLPFHHKARKDGYVYLHQLQAEKLLNRPLDDKECVHHIDGNKFNNDINNLMVFKTKSDHSAFHKGSSIYKFGDVWFAELNKNSICPICNNNIKDSNARMCLNCFRKYKSKNIPPKDTLLNLILNLPFVKIGEIYGVSDNAVRKWCKKYELPFKRRDIIQYKNVS